MDWKNNARCIDMPFVHILPRRNPRDPGSMLRPEREAWVERLLNQKAKQNFLIDSRNQKL